MASSAFPKHRPDKGITPSTPFSGHALFITTVIAALGLLFLPASAKILDALFALNFTLTLAVLVAGLSFADPVRFSSFPGLILFLTLFRLALGLSSTRLILTEANAGNLVMALGEFAAGGNAVVGVVVFLVLQIVHFMVVSKGSERIAEVAARFTLDALPGKQMSIDADLRAGLIDEAEARGKRDALLKESRFYGAMDGAMKFVKGECAAIFAVAVVNIAGGFLIGVCLRGMSLAQAARTYALLTLGDGLAAELPAFVIAMTAGFLVTRVPSGDDSPLGRDIAEQLFGNPNPLWGAAAALSAMAFFPGFPAAFFGAAATAMGIAALRAAKKCEAKTSLLQAKQNLETSLEEAMPGFTPAFSLEISPQRLRAFSNDERWQRFVYDAYPQLRTLLTARMGVAFPELKIVGDETLGNETLRFKIHGLQIDEVRFDFDAASAEESLLRHMGSILRRHAGDFVGIQEVRDILNGIEARFPELVREVVPRLLTVAKLADVVKRLVDEEVPVNDFRLILETLATSQADTKDAVALTEQVRIGMRRVLSRRHSRGTGTLHAFLIAPEIESSIEEAIVRDGTEHYLSLPAEKSERLATAFAAAFARQAPEKQRPVILTHVGIRRFVRRLIENELPGTAVLSYQELEPRLAIETRGTISLEAA